METVKNCFICSYFNQNVDYNDKNPIDSKAKYECLAEMDLTENGTSFTLKERLASHTCCHVSYDKVLMYDSDFTELSEEDAKEKYLEKYYRED